MLIAIKNARDKKYNGQYVVISEALEEKSFNTLMRLMCMRFKNWE